MADVRLGVLVAVLGVLVSQQVDAAGGKDEETDWPVVIAKLRHESQNRPGFGAVRQQLAVALNNYGVSLAEQGQWDLARAQLEEAMDLDPHNAQFAKNLASVHLREGHDAYEAHRSVEAKTSLERAIALDPGLAQAHALVGDIEYDNQQLVKARAAWQKAVELDPQLSQLTERLERLSQELPVESKFERLSQAYFDLRYEEHLERPVGFDIRDALLQARREVGSDFAYWPKYRIVVLVYSAESFRSLRQETPEWVAGQYDGKIRVPLPGGQLNPDTVKQILFHEYTHALVHDLARDKCPVWFNEGLAEYEGLKYGPKRLEQLAAAMAGNHLISWAQLDDQFSNSQPAEDVALGYQQAYSIVRYFVERYSFWRIRRVLSAVASGEPIAEVLPRELRLKVDRLEATWRDWLPSILQP